MQKNNVHWNVDLVKWKLVQRGAWPGRLTLSQVFTNKVGQTSASAGPTESPLTKSEGRGQTYQCFLPHTS